MAENKNIPGVTMPWEEKKKEYPVIKGDVETVKKWWEQIDGVACAFLWFVVTAM